MAAHTISGVLGEHIAHLNAISVSYLDMERDLAMAQQRVVELEAREAQWRARDAHLLDQLATRLQTMVGLQEQRIEMQVELQQLKDERMQHIQALAQMGE
jgi:hypothetical protein